MGCFLCPLNPLPVELQRESAGRRCEAVGRQLLTTHLADRHRTKSSVGTARYARERIPTAPTQRQANMATYDTGARSGRTYLELCTRSTRQEELAHARRVAVVDCKLNERERRYDENARTGNWQKECMRIARRRRR